MNWKKMLDMILSALPTLIRALWVSIKKLLWILMAAFATASAPYLAVGALFLLAIFVLI